MSIVIDVTIDATSLRERKKARTRLQLAQAGLRLIGEQGYEATTVAQIAAAAEVSTKTFFSYFPSKADVLFAEPYERIETATATIANLAPHEPPIDALRQAMSALLAADDSAEPDSGMLRQRLIATEPAVQTRALTHTLSAQSQIVEALHRAYPDRLNHLDTVAAIGAIVGALIATLHDGIRHGLPAEELRRAATRATQITINGVASALD